MRLLLLAALPLAIACQPPPPTLEQALRQRLTGDRTGACVAGAIVGRTTQRAIVCADPAREKALEGRVAFEIGSITKTFTATVIASLAREGRLSLEDPLAKHLPPGTKVPTFEGKPILLKHLVTHTSALPQWPVMGTDPANPYADISEAKVLARLEDMVLPRAPGTEHEYSNFGYMLLSVVAARVSHEPFDRLLNERLFTPLGMKDAFVTTAPAGVRFAKGHAEGGREVSEWAFQPATAGPGGVRATLDDMIRYAEAQVGKQAAVGSLLQSTHAPLTVDAPITPEMAMGWARQQLPSGLIVLHDGETGGFSSLMTVDDERGEAVVLLSDTAMTVSGALAEVFLTLTQPSFPAQPARRVATPPAALLERLAGHYDLGDSQVELVVREGALVATAEGTSTVLGFDSRGDFYAPDGAWLATPVTTDAGVQTFVLSSPHLAITATRLP